MYVYGRLLKLIALAPFRARQAPLAEIRTPIRIWPNDLDFNMHVNNGRYLTLFDLGRLDLTLRTGLWRVMLRRRWLPVLSTAAVRFRRPVGPFASVAILTRIVHWDEKWIYMEQRLEHAGKVCAIALVKGLFRGPTGNVPVADLLTAINANATASTPPPALITDWQQFEANLH